MYTKHIYLTKQKDGVSSSWYFWRGGQEKYSYGIVNDENGMKVGVKKGEIVPENATKPEGAIDDASNYYTAEGRIEIATGSREETRIRKVNENNNTSTFAVLRGGSFHNNGSGNPVVYRLGYGTVEGMNVNIGFRTVLYIK